MNKTTVGENVKRLRIEARLTQQKLARMAGLTDVSMVERGERPNARLDTLEKIAEALGVSVATLFLEPGETIRRRKVTP